MPLLLCFVTMELDSPSSHSLSLYEKERLGNALKINLLCSVKKESHAGLEQHTGE